MKNYFVRLLFDKNIFSNRYKVAIIFVAYVFLLYFVYCYACEINIGGDAWKTGDWLINYEGGWVRRGLIGQVLYEISGFGVSLVWVAFLLQTLIYLSTAHFVLKIFFSTRREISWLLFLFSPAFIFLFPFYDIQGGFRKEIIVFLAFCLLAVGLMHGGFNKKYLVSSLFLYAIAVFSHELAASCIIFFVHLLFEHTRSDANLRSIGRVYITGFIIVAVAGLLFSFIFPGTIDTADKICESLQHRGLTSDICSGAIKALGVDSSSGWKQVMARIQHYAFLYPPLFVLAMIPLSLTDWWSRRLPVLLVGFVFVAPLFLVAKDWGRWIHVYFSMISVLLLCDSSNIKTRIYKLPLIGVIIYAGVWSIPHSGASLPGFGMCSVAYRIVHDDEGYNNRGNAYFEKGLYDQAISDFSKALEINPKYGEAYRNRAVTYYLTKNYNKSWDDVSKAKELGLSIEPTFIDALRKASGRQ